MASVPLKMRSGSSLRESGYGSGVRDVPDAEHEQRRALFRVQEYLRIHGLTEPTRREALAAQIVAAHAQQPDVASLAVTDVQQRWQSFVREVFGDDARSLDPMWLRSFVEAHPDLCLGDVAQARAAASRFGDLQHGELPRDARLIEQQFGKAHLGSWFKGLAPALLVTTGLCSLLLWQLAVDGLSALELLWCVSFFCVFLLPALGASTALIGFFSPRLSPPIARSTASLPRSVIVVPIYHEHVERVFAAVAAIAESLQQTPGGTCFEIFVLSDSRDPQCAADEERAFRRVTALESVSIPIYYRRRVHNREKKAGNVAEFIERFGARYTYAVVLDADSLMTGNALVELVQRMEAAPKVGLIQAALHLHAGETLLARTQQLMASVTGPLLMRGLARWAGQHGNYYGHNAILRVSAFMQCCGLPQLSGPPPFGGHFLSHDFVEAALLARGGWEVRSAWDVNESWEEMPQALNDYVARDRRWCQGNLQHLRIVFAAGLAPMSRIHLLIGAFSYLAAPALLLFVGLGVVLASVEVSGLSRAVSMALIGATCTTLLLPRVLALVDVARDRVRRRQHGGLLRLLASMVMEALLSAWLAPLFLLHHTRTVLSIGVGRAVGWSAQNREAASSLGALLRLELPTTLFGLALFGAVHAFLPELTWWLMPLWLPCVLAIPLAIAVSSSRIGRIARVLGLFATASEVEPHPLLLRAAELRAMTVSHAAARFRDLVLDPVLLATHIKRLPKNHVVDPHVNDAFARAVRLGPAALTNEERAVLQADAAALTRLHHEAWRRWPVESWELSRERPQLPPVQ